jgi:hypothetical protein
VQKIKEGCSDVERQNMFVDKRDKKSLIFHCEMQYERVKELYTVCCTRKVRSGLA